MKFEGVTIKGAGRGKKLGFPTINIELASPEYEEGVFAVSGELNGQNFEGVAHFGPRPTFGDENLSVEIHIFDFEQKEITEKMPVSFQTVGKKIRSIIKFISTEELRKQIMQDINVAHELLGQFYI